VRVDVVTVFRLRVEEEVGVREEGLRDLDVDDVGTTEDSLRGRVGEISTAWRQK
jgi:hypothetical protein